MLSQDTQESILNEYVVVQLDHIMGVVCLNLIPFCEALLCSDEAQALMLTGSFPASSDANAPFAQWSTERVCMWLEDFGLAQYVIFARQWVTSGHTLLTATPQDMEKVRAEPWVRRLLLLPKPMHGKMNSPPFLPTHHSDNMPTHRKMGKGGQDSVAAG